MNITVIGGGNIGTLISAQLSKNNNVCIYTSKPDKWSKSICVYDEDINASNIYQIYKITNSPKEAAEFAELIIFTLPAFAIKDTIKLFEHFIKEGTKVLFYPGTGGIEFCCVKLIEKNCVIMGTQRVCSVARLTQYGHSVKTSGKRKEMYIGILKGEDKESLRKMFEDLFEIQTFLLPNYLSVTFTPSNPILHTARLYSILKNYESGMTYDKIPLFYEEWDDESSINLIKCDQELQNLCKKLDKMNLSGVKSLLVHYESTDYESLTKKITSIQSFRGLETPSVCIDGKLIPDFSSRYFTADFPYGLVIIKAFGLILKEETNMIDKIINWYQGIVKKEYIDFQNKTLGIDAEQLNLPQHLNINDKKSIYKFYDEVKIIKK